jgi:cytochrome c556
MSGSGFHVHGPHDHELEHVAHGASGAHGSSDNFAGRIAVMTAIMATVGALFSYQGGATQSDAMIFKNDAAIKKTEAANQWAYFQSKGGKQNLAELGASLSSGDIKEKFVAEAARYSGEKKGIEAEARKLDQASRDAEVKSEHALHLHHRWAQAMTAMQVGISLAAITLLTRKKWMQYAAYGISAVGVALAITAMLGK